MGKSLKVAIAGNPNCGKTTLFNSLTGGKQTIGNWPGVTVEKKEGRYSYKGRQVEVVDLPGIYSLSAHSEDERAAMDYLNSHDADLVINVVDALNLERNLYLTVQLAEMKVPMLVVLNRMDLAEKDKISIDINHLSEHLGVPVVGASAIKKYSVESVKDAIESSLSGPTIPSLAVDYPDEIRGYVNKWSSILTGVAGEFGANPRWFALKMVEGDRWAVNGADSSGLIGRGDVVAAVHEIESYLHESPDIVIADYRYGYINSLVREVVTRKVDRQRVSDIIDRVVLNRVLGIPVFLVVMYFVFWAAISLGGAFVDFFDIAFGAIFVDGFGYLLGLAGTPAWLNALLAGGIGAGIQTVATFVPIIFMMFFMLSLLEDSGYMARIAFVMDRFMRFIGLPGKSFVPLLVGYGCTVPAVLATRTLESRRDRLLTILIAPFMSCGARLPVYALFASSFFPGNAGLVVFSLYIVGIALAVVSGLVLKNTLFVGEPSHFIMELPVYNPPRFKHIIIHTWIRLKEFVVRAGQVIVIGVAALSFFNSLGTDGTFGNEGTAKSVLANAGKAITPVFYSMGVQSENWPAAVAIFSGIFAKESVVGTLNSIYSQIDYSSAASESAAGEPGAAGDAGPGVGSALIEAISTIPENLKQTFVGITDPLGIQKEFSSVNNPSVYEDRVHSSLRRHFKNNAEVYAYLLFILIYFPCIAALGAVSKEAGLKIAVLQALFLTLLGWIAATLFYQFAAGGSIMWISISAAMLLLMVLSLRIMRQKPDDEVE